MCSVFVEFNEPVSLSDIQDGLAFEASEIIHQNIVDSMNEPKHGKPYKHQDGSIRPASAEGEAPGIDSKDLVGSFDVIAVSATEGQIYSDIAYLEFLEARNRPTIQPAIDKAEPEIAELVKKKVEEKWR